MLSEKLRNPTIMLKHRRRMKHLRGWGRLTKRRSWIPVKFPTHLLHIQLRVLQFELNNRWNSSAHDSSTPHLGGSKTANRVAMGHHGKQQNNSWQDRNCACVPRHYSRILLILSLREKTALVQLL